ncbi:ornithine carbamoyltransferase [Paenibacillus phyllosphaerae]|uniref:Ornithine carbamoyltransferase n=1 Tax=Paenibacillus phyllosphaerae TaxID=274593 RepID=A0A7W5FQH7_9BACL|nr:ornithine carbamoyltransferase [Paenibacillus phyllosphaerae]MBB3113262.1 ornithine carbamoyltransferase [Paenibacillus phyllosphaerae]
MHMIQLADLTSEQLEAILELADQLSAHPGQRLLAGRTFILFFPETSLRTRVTFERGIAALGGHSILFPPASLDKREALRDVAGYLANWADGLIVRHPHHERIAELAAVSSIPVVNAMSSEGHPCEILADLYALRALRPHYRSLRYTFVGPVGNISRSWMEAAEVLGLDFHHVCVQGERLGEDRPFYTFHTELDPALAGSDVILTDSLPGYLRYDDYISRYQITSERLRLAAQDVLLIPCPPFYRGEEVSDCAIASDAFVGYSFKASLLPVQQAILLYSLGLSAEDVAGGRPVVHA